MYRHAQRVAPREGRVSRNCQDMWDNRTMYVAPREGRVSRNDFEIFLFSIQIVAPREGRVSRNQSRICFLTYLGRRAPRGACE